MLPYLEIGSFRFPMYTLMIVLGSIAFIATLIWQFKMFQVRVGVLFFLLTTLFGVGFFVMGASLWDNICHALDGTAPFGKAGISFLGGVCIGLPLYYGLLWAVYQRKMPIRVLLNCLIPCILIAHVFGRIGCLCAGCCYGKPTDWAWGLIYPEGSVAAQTYSYGTRLIPTQIIEAVFLLTCFVLFVTVPLFKQRRVMWYCLFYGVYRFFAEYLRGDSRGAFIPGLSPSQFLSLLLVVTGIAIDVVQRFFLHENGTIPPGKHYVLARIGGLGKKPYFQTVDRLEEEQSSVQSKK